MPSWLVFTSRVRLVPTCVTVIFVLGSAAPFGSTTSPVICPELFCAWARGASRSSRQDASDSSHRPDDLTPRRVCFLSGARLRHDSALLILGVSSSDFLRSGLTP